MKRANAVRSKNNRRGYTAIEVLMSLTILAIGATGVISMQRGAIQGNIDARRLDMASAIGRQWTERLRRDAMAWTLPNAASPVAKNISNAKLLGASGSNVDGKWRRPIELMGGTVEQSPGFDLLGRDVPLGQLGKHADPSDPSKTLPGDVVFCTNVRLTWLVQDELVRAEVRVFWPRNLSAKQDDDFCTASATPVASDPPSAVEVEKYHFVYTVTSLRRNALP